MSVSGTYDIAIKTPMGDQKTRLTINADGNRLTGRASGAQGEAELEDGRVNGDTITWTMNVKVPMPMKLEGTATIQGDSMTGQVKAGVFGMMPLTGTRVG